MTDLKDMKIDLSCWVCGSIEIVHTYTIWNSKGTQKKGILGVCAKCKPEADQLMNAINVKR